MKITLLFALIVGSAFAEAGPGGEGFEVVEEKVFRRLAACDATDGKTAHDGDDDCECKDADQKCAKTKFCLKEHGVCLDAAIADCEKTDGSAATDKSCTCKDISCKDKQLCTVDGDKGTCKAAACTKTDGTAKDGAVCDCGGKECTDSQFCMKDHAACLDAAIADCEKTDGSAATDKSCTCKDKPCKANEKCTVDGDKGTCAGAAATTTAAATTVAATTAAAAAATTAAAAAAGTANALQTAAAAAATAAATSALKALDAAKATTLLKAAKIEDADFGKVDLTKAEVKNTGGVVSIEKFNSDKDLTKLDTKGLQKLGKSIATAVGLKNPSHFKAAVAAATGRRLEAKDYTVTLSAMLPAELIAAGAIKATSTVASATQVAISVVLATFFI